MSFFGKNDFKALVQLGRVPGWAVMEALGEFEGAGTDVAGEDCYRGTDFTPDGPVRLPTPAAAGEQLTVISDDAQDGVGGTGVQNIRLEMLDASGSEFTEDLVMNGTTGVDIVATDARFVNDVYAIPPIGTGGVAAGNIAVYKKGGTVAADLYQMIAEGGNKSLVPHRMVPFGKKLLLQDWHSEEAQNKRCAFRIRSTDMNGVLLPGVFCFKGVSYIKQGATGPLRLGAIVPALSIVKISVWPDAAGAEGSTGWWGFLVDDA
ncbi:MAG: hypothetical protein GY716_15690 [bacterium]|nr:hypothetical protein [bacterium]